MSYQPTILTDLKDGQLRDMYRAVDLVHDWKTLLNKRDVEPPYIVIKARREVYPMKNGSATIRIPKRNFKALLLERVP